MKKELWMNDIHFPTSKKVDKMKNQESFEGKLKIMK